MPRERRDRVKMSGGMVDRKLVEWVDKMVAKNRFRDRISAVELALQLLKEKYEEEGKD